MTEVEFEKVCSITTSLETIARQLKIANTLKAIELRTRGVPYDEAVNIIMQTEGVISDYQKDAQPGIDPLEKALREDMDILRNI